MFVVKPRAPEPAAIVKDGTYRAKVSNIKNFHNAYGQRVGFEFTLMNGEQQGSKVMRSTAPQLTRQSKLAEVIEGILGRPMTTTELTGGFDLADLMGKECSLLVLTQRNKAGVAFSNVERVFTA
jgi:hypothetical protein